MRVQSTTPAATTAAKAVKPVERQAATAPKTTLDSVKLTTTTAPPSLTSARQTIAALASTPSIPLKNDEKTAWLADAKKKQTAANAALDVLRDAEWNKKIPDTELDAAREAVYNFSDKIEKCEQRAGLKPLPATFNPFRRVFDLSRSLKEGASRNPLTAILGALIIVPVTVIDIVDLVTRPIQVVAWPFAAAWRGIRLGANKFGIG